MNETQFREILALGHELSGVEFKGPGLRTDRALFAQVARAALGMSNRRDGGLIVIGVDQEKSGAPLPLGLADSQLTTWDYDSVADSLDEYADPNVVFELRRISLDGMDFIIIEVAEFADIPVLCSRSYDDVLRRGACYVRPRRKPETTEVASQEDMRDLLDIATEKRLRKFVRQAASAGLLLTSGSVPDDKDRFDDQVAGFLGQPESAALVQKIRQRGYWQVTVRPSRFDPHRIDDFSQLYAILQKCYVSHKGLDFPAVNPAQSPQLNLDWIAQDFEFSHFLSSWRFYQSGLFIMLFSIPDDWRDQSLWWHAPQDWAPMKDLGVGQSMLVFVDTFEFAARLTETSAGDDSMYVEVKGVTLEGRQLYIDDPQKWGFFVRRPVATLSEFPYSQTVPRSELLATPRELAIRGAAELFKRFGWDKTIKDLVSLFEDYLRR